MAGAHSITDLVRPHGRHGTELVAEFRDNRRAGWGDEFVCFLALSQRDATEDLKGRRGRDREAAMLALQPTASLLKSGNIDPLHPQRFHPDADTDNVRNRVKRTHLVKVDFLRRGAVYFGLRNGYPGKNRKRVFLHKRRKRTGFNQLFDVLVGTLRCMRV